MKILQIIFCVLACLSVAAFVPIAVYFQLWCLVCLGGAVLFGGLMIGAKKGFRRTPPPQKPDFMKSAEENAKIGEESARERKEKD